MNPPGSKPSFDSNPFSPREARALRRAPCHPLPKRRLNEGGCLIALLFLLFFSGNALAQETPTLTIYGRIVEPLRLSLVPFLAASPYTPEEESRFLTRLTRDLEYHGAFTTFVPTLPPSAGFPVTDYGYFKALGADLVLSLRVTREGSGLRAAFILGEAATARQILGKELLYPSPPHPPLLADTIATRVVEELLKVPPPFGKRILFQYREPGSRWRALGMVDFLGEGLTIQLKEERLILSPVFVDTNNGVAIGNAGATPALLLFPLGGGGGRILYRSHGNLFHVAVQPGGSLRFAFSEERNNNLDLYLWEEGRITRLTTHPQADYSPVFSPDGKELAFVSERTGTPQLWLKNLASGVETPLYMGEGILSAPDWSPDGQYLAFIQSVGNRFRLVVFELANRTPTTLLEDQVPLEHPSFATDSRTILFSRLDGNRYALYRVDRLIPIPKPLLRLPGDARMPSWER